ncbi:MAG: hypothetical protein CMJ50_07870 [Planctomycetaceae bacterium]|nr:hypothetical protein [Planctomycetaceae bacterium]
MKRSLFLTFAFVFALASLNVTLAMAQRGRRSSQSATRQSWSSNYQESLATARRLDKPLMVVFRCIP